MMKSDSHRSKTKYIALGGIIAALYVALTYFASVIGLASGVIQFRISEALCILPIFTPAAIPGLYIGCFLANLLTGCAIWDVIFGSIATLLGAIGTWLLRKKHRFLASIPPIVSNMVIIPFILQYVYGAEDTYLFLMVTVGIGEVVCAGILGQVLYQALWSHRNIFMV